jgi:large subunit ribosomal protein L5
VQKLQKKNLDFRMTRFLEHYRLKVLPQLKKELELNNNLAVPRLEKIVINVGIGKLLQQDPKNLEKFKEDFKKITGQQPRLARTKKSIAGFKVREGQIVGLMATLRGKRMHDFLDKLVNVALPRSRDFRGVSRKGFDGRGNYSLGLKEHVVFPEMAQEESGTSFGVEITIATTAGNDEKAYKLLKKLGFPFRD